MAQPMLGITDYLWRLIPANPILLRVVEAGGKRRRDLFIRCGYLGLLVGIVVLILLQGSDSYSGSSLSQLAQQSASIFQTLSYVQLGLVALLAPIFTAGAITQEKDSQTYDILLSTPLTNGQIVLGSLLSRLFFVIALLLSGIPIFSITQIFGGVAISSIVRSFGIAAATAFVTGALAMAIAVFKVGTRRTIFSFYMFIVLYLVGLFLLDKLETFKVVLQRDPQGNPTVFSQTGWLTGIHPFLALRTIFHDPSYTPPNLTDLPEGLRWWPLGTFLTNPAGFYTGFMFLLSFALVTPSIILLRRLAQSTTSIKTRVLQKLRLVRGDRTRKPRSVWANPIAWREAKTKASAARASLLRYGFMAAGVIAALVLAVRYASVETPQSYIDTGSYNEQFRTLVVYHPDAPSDVYVVPFGAQVTLNDRAVNLGELTGRLAVQVVPKRRADKTLEATAITAKTPKRTASAEDTRRFLLGLTTVEFFVILLIVTNAAASTVTREKEDGSLDLLLTTPITSRYYIWGKLRGLVSFVLPLVAVPVASAAVFILWDMFRRVGDWADPTFQWVVLPEAVLILPAMLIIVAAFAAIVGMQMSLRCRTTVMAVMSSVGIVAGLCGALGWCGWTALQNTTQEMGIVVGSFSPFTVMTLLINPQQTAERIFGNVGDPSEQGWARTLLFLFSFAAVGAYTAVVWSMYRSMVKNFDMTIRRQSR